MKIYNIDNFKTSSRIKKYMFEKPMFGYFFKTISCNDWKENMRTQVYIDVKFKGEYKDFLINIFDGKKTNADIQILSETKRRNDYDKKKKQIETEEIDVNLMDIFHDNIHIIIKDYNPEKTDVEPNLFNCLLYYLLMNDDINLNLFHKTISINKLRTLGNNGKEIYETLKDITNFQKEVGRKDDFDSLLKDYYKHEKRKEIII